MRAAVYHGVRDLRVEDVPEPSPGPGEVKIEVGYNGLCGTDVHEVFDGPRAVPMSPHPLTGATAPVIFGHEAAGFVVELGAGVRTMREGDLVTIEPTVHCGTCPPCVSGDYNLCDRLAFHGLSTGGGGLAEYTTVAATMAHVLPAGTDPRAAALVEPLAVAHHAVARSGARKGAFAAVHGGGPIGLAVALTLRAIGVECAVLEPAPRRRAIVESLGLAAVDPLGDADDIGQEIRAHTNGRGADVSFDAAGGPATFRAAVATTARHGTVVVVASPRRPAATPVLSELLAREIDVRASYAYCGDFPAVIAKLLDGAYPIDGWISTMPISDIARALELVHSGELAKVLIDPTT